MRPLRLDVAGFTVFREPATLDLTGADLFALVGPTGSGKSTLLDAICFALYGTVPRWGKRGGIAGALAPSSTEARVRLVFEVSGARYVATRVVRRVGKTPQTRHAGLERLHPDVDISTLGDGLADDQLGEVLAGSPAEMERAVERVIGLPYEQFITCVLLPQGAFAEFLHATPASRQQILVNLLGLGVYDDIRDRATTRATEAEGKLTAIQTVLAGEVPSAADLTEATERLGVLRALTADVEACLPALTAAETTARVAGENLRRAEDELRDLGAVTAPADPQASAERVRTAETALRQADIDVAEAEAAEELLLRERDLAPDPATLATLLDAYRRADEIPAEIERHSAALALAEGAHAASATAAAAAARVLASAEMARDRARDSQLAAALRGNIRPGDNCPVCTQKVGVLPDVDDDGLLSAAEGALDAARMTHERCQNDLRTAERESTTASTRLAETRGRLQRAEAWFADKPDRVAATAALAAAADVAKRLDAVGAESRGLRARRQAAQAELDAARVAAQRAWGDYDRARDAVARFGPPVADREDLPGSWRALTGWARAHGEVLTAARDEARAVARGAEESLSQARDVLDGLFNTAGISCSGQYVRDAAVALERAHATHRVLLDATERAERLRLQQEVHEHEARVARALAQHLGATNFKRWLLAEALDQLVDGASTLLLELSGGQYELGHDKGEFFVIDHHDAEVRRGVRTLSGGETFQASLALALSLSERLAGMSTGARALGSIILDEGFGTLDTATLDSVTATLENLAARGDRLVGVVTHVPALAERIPIRYEVSKNAHTARVERVS